ncbi:hypothetical protein HYV81_04930 [Candidatus Woesearchaeota archaeon]|nr:hypothetical protein [Candidatus Woesearchaeota archaeon]
MKKFHILLLIAILALVIAGCKADQSKVDVSTEPLDAADALDVQPDPAADLGNETLSAAADDTSEQEDIFENPV